MDTKDGTTAPVAETPAPDRETNPNTNDAGAAPAAEPATGGDAGQLDQSRDHTGDAQADMRAAPDPEFEARMAQERAAFEKERAETPPQTVKLRPASGQKLLGFVVHEGRTGKVLRVARMEDWRTDEITLHLREVLVVHLLAGEGLDNFEFFERQLRAANAPTPVDPVVAPATPASINGPQDAAGDLGRAEGGIAQATGSAGV